MNKKSSWVVIVFKEIKITFVIKIGEKKTKRGIYKYD